ncbi:unnamed protein product, partial [Tuber aestivum]
MPLFFLLHYSDIVAIQFFRSSFVVTLTVAFKSLRRARKTGKNRVSRAVGVLLEIGKISDEYFSSITKCEDPEACTILLRVPPMDILYEIKCNLQDAVAVARNVFFYRRLASEGGAVEVDISVHLAEISESIEGMQQWPYKGVVEALELRTKHLAKEHARGIDGETGKIVDMEEYGVWEPEAVKPQSVKTAIESTRLQLRVDEICSAKGAKQSGRAGRGQEE